MATKRCAPSSRRGPTSSSPTLRCPGLTGLEVAAELKRRSVPVRVIILTTFARAGYLRRALDAGASGYLLKDMPAEQLAEAVRRVHRGLRVIDPQLAAEAWTDDADPLTERERQVLRLAGEGMASADIATELNLSEGTVRNYLSEASARWVRPTVPRPRALPAPKDGCESSAPCQTFPRRVVARGYSKNV